MIIIKPCQKCGQEFNAYSKWQDEKKFCSLACRNSARSRSIEQRLRTAKSVETSILAIEARNRRSAECRSKLIDKQCPVCNVPFKVRQSESRKIYCSKACYNADTLLQHRKKPKGGFRPTAVRSRHGTYKGIYCASSWELAFLIYHLDHNSNITRCVTYYPYTYNDKEFRYLPDFEIDGVIYEIKGQETEIDRIKVKAANAIMIDSSKMKPYLEYVSKKYKVDRTKLWLLYDEKQYNSCELCATPFVPKTKTNRFCSRACAAKNNRTLSAKFRK